MLNALSLVFSISRNDVTIMCLRGIVNVTYAEKSYHIIDVFALFYKKKYLDFF